MSFITHGEGKYLTAMTSQEKGRNNFTAAKLLQESSQAGYVRKTAH